MDVMTIIGAAIAIVIVVSFVMVGFDWQIERDIAKQEAERERKRHD